MSRDALVTAWLTGCFWVMDGCAAHDDPAQRATATATGEVHASLRLSDGAELEAVDYLLTSDSGYFRSGRVAVADATLLRFRLGGVPVSADPYFLVLTAMGRKGLSCGGSADFVVGSAAVTRLSVLVECVAEDVQGDLIIDGEFRSCPLISALEAIPAEIQLDASTQLHARLSHGTSRVHWSGSGGVFSAPEDYTTDFRCDRVGVHTLTATVSQPGCSESASLEILCAPRSSAGTSPAGVDARPVNATCLASSAGSAPALRLADTGCFDPARPSEPLPVMLPFDVNAPLWSDGASKRRWFAIPDGAELSLGEDGDLIFPEGSVLAKEFRMGERLLETRILMYQRAGSNQAGTPLAPRWFGVSYRWNAEQTAATLVVDNGDNEVDIDGMGPLTQMWRIPTRSDCMTCHTAVAGFSLGPELSQLNRDLTYPSSGRTANQLVTLASIGWLPRALGDSPQSWPRLADYRATDDPEFGLEQRARAYLHANCSMCHRKPSAGGTASPAPEDFRATLPFSAMHACNESPRTGAAIGLRMNLTRARILAPGAPDDSVMYRRMTSRPSLQMPPLGTQKVDPLGSLLIDSWIRSISQCPP